MNDKIKNKNCPSPKNVDSKSRGKRKYNHGKWGILFFLFLSVGGYAQQEEKAVFHYLFPEFRNGTALMKDGTKNKAMLNYNAATEEMIFDQNGQKLAFAEVTLNQLDTIFVDDRKFITLENKKIAEVLTHNGYTLLVQYKCKIIPPGKPSAYGGTSQISATTSYSSWSGDGRVYELKLPDDYKIEPYNVYWMDNGSGLKSLTSLRQVRRFYNKQRSAYDKYTRENNVDFQDPESMAALFVHMETSTR